MKQEPKRGCLHFDHTADECVSRLLSENERLRAAMHIAAALLADDDNCEPLAALYELETALAAKKG